MVEAPGNVAQPQPVAEMTLPADVVNLPAVEMPEALTGASVPAYMPAGPEHAAAAVAAAENTDTEVADVAGHDEGLQAYHELREGCIWTGLAYMQSHSGLVVPESLAGDVEDVEGPKSFDDGHCFLMMDAILLAVVEYVVDGGRAFH